MNLSNSPQKAFCYFIFCVFQLSFLVAWEKPYVIGRLDCQLGNNCFQIAAACAHAWKHNAHPCFPDLAELTTNNMPLNYENIFFRCDAKQPKKRISFSWQLPANSLFTSCKIPYKPNMEILVGTFQSENYFKKYKKRIAKLFAPHPKNLEYIYTKYSSILQHPLTVGIQVRWFGCQQDLDWNVFLAQYGYDFFNQAMAMFPPETLFIVCTNDLTFAKENIPKHYENVIFLENEPYYIDFTVLSLCKHNIISNSSFGWWAAWLNQNPEKMVVVPENWIDPIWYNSSPVTDVWPPSWIKIKAKYGKPIDPIDSFR